MVWLGFAAMLLAALGFLGAVFFNKNLDHPDDLDSAEVVRQSNISSFRNRQTELDAQLASDDIDNLQYQGLLVEAQRSLLDDVAVVASNNASISGRWLLTSCGVLVIALASVLYYYLGAAADVEIRRGLEQVSDGPQPALTEQIRARLKQRPDNFFYWALLARFDHQDGKLADALQSYQRALMLSPEDNTIRSEYAQVLFIAAGSVVTEAVSAQVQQVLARDSKDSSALGLRGIGFFAAGDYRAALADWQQALQSLPPRSEAAGAMRSGIAAAQARLGESNGNSSGAGIRARVALGDDFATILESAPETLVFIYVQEWQGMPMPMMARRVTVADLPLEIEFSNDQALMPGRDFSTVAKFEVVARVSHAGTPLPASGDYEGRHGPIELESKTDAPGETRTFSLTIDRLLP
ncbi:MAG: c-type cytochrome biogenesis protein CcmI [Porticoccaceae bacterium]